MTYPACIYCADTGPHRLRETGAAVEVWTCGMCGEDFNAEIATIEDAGKGVRTPG